MSDPIKPGRVMMEVADSWFVFGMTGYFPKPGQAYARLPDETREILKGLKSEDIANVRVPEWMRCDGESKRR